MHELGARGGLHPGKHAKYCLNPRTQTHAPARSILKLNLPPPLASHASSAVAAMPYCVHTSGSAHLRSGRRPKRGMSDWVVHRLHMVCWCSSQTSSEQWC